MRKKEETGKFFVFGQCQSLARRCVQSRVPRPWVAAAPRASVGNQRPLRTAELRGRDVGCVACVSEPAVAPVGVVGLRPPHLCRPHQPREPVRPTLLTRKEVSESYQEKHIISD